MSKTIKLRIAAFAVVCLWRQRFSKRAVTNVEAKNIHWLWTTSATASRNTAGIRPPEWQMKDATGIVSPRRRESSCLDDGRRLANCLNFDFWDWYDWYD
ncbi:MAG: hypothetical protein LBS09_09025 [Bacteroidales bacterium]|nr:hypothetical protein [Bacteroidales bacterium]